MTASPQIEDYPSRSHDKLRYADTDRQGHVNNAVFATLCETGRVELFYAAAAPPLDADRAFVIARLALDFLGELLWPGTAEIGTRVTRLGRSSIALEQALFQNGRCIGRAESVVVLTNSATRRSHPLSAAAIDYLSRFLAPVNR